MVFGGAGEVARCLVRGGAVPHRCWRRRPRCVGTCDCAACARAQCHTHGHGQRTVHELPMRAASGRYRGQGCPPAGVAPHSDGAGGRALRRCRRARVVHEVRRWAEAVLQADAGAVAATPVRPWRLWACVRGAAPHQWPGESGPMIGKGVMHALRGGTSAPRSTLHVLPPRPELNVNGRTGAWPPGPGAAGRLSAPASCGNPASRIAVGINCAHRSLVLGVHLRLSSPPLPCPGSGSECDHASLSGGDAS